MITPAIEIRDEVTPTLRVLPSEVGKATKADIRKGGAMVAKAWQLMLSGPATPRRLGIRSGQLRRSIAVSLIGEHATRIAPDDAHSWVGAHEFGVDKNVNVRAHAVREFSRAGSRVKAHVRGPFQRHMRLPKRPSRSPAVKLIRPALDALFRGDIRKAGAIAQERGRRLAASSRIVGGHMGAAARRGGF